MTAKKTAANTATTVVANDPADQNGRLKHIGGSKSDHWNKRPRQSDGPSPVDQQLGQGATRPAVERHRCSAGRDRPQGRVGRHDRRATRCLSQRCNGVLSARNDRRGA